MANVYDDALLKRKPKFSYYNPKPVFKMSGKIGRLYPVFYRNMVPGERLRMTISHLTRFCPMVAPVMDNFDLDFMAFDVPKRVIDHYFGTHTYKFFNPATPDANRGNMPSLALGEIYQFGDITGKLPDFFGYSSLINVLDDVRTAVSQSIYHAVNGDEEFGQLSLSSTEFVTFTLSGGLTGYAFPYLIADDDDRTPAPSFTLFGKTFTVTITGYMKFLVDRLSLVNPELAAKFQTIYGVISELPKVEDIYRELNLTSYVLYNEYLQKIFSDVIAAGFAQVPAVSDKLVNVLPFLSYWTVIADWFINSNIDGDSETFINNVIGSWCGLDEFEGGPYSWSEYSRITDSKFFEPFHRYWKNDLFTSAFPNALYSSNQVAIPESGTMQDLRAATIVDRFKQSILYSGKRYIDAIKAVFGQSSSNALLDRSSCIGIKSYKLSIDALSQTNQGDINTLLETPTGTLIGQGTSVSKSDFLFDYRCEEHSSIIVLACVRPRASYFQGINRENLKQDYYDFLIPEFSQIGEQPIDNMEIYFDKGFTSGTFGFNRRYYEYIDVQSSVHGDFRTSLDYWHSSRKFSSQPTLSSPFLQVNFEEEDGNRIFAVDGPDNIYMMIREEIDLLTPVQKLTTYEV